MGCQQNKCLLRRLTYSMCIWGHFKAHSLQLVLPHPCREGHNLHSIPTPLHCPSSARAANAKTSLSVTVKYCKAPARSSQTATIRSLCFRPFSGSACLTHLESGPRRQPPPSGTGKQPGELSGVCLGGEGSGADVYPRTCSGCSRLSSTPLRSSRPPLLSALLPRLPLLRSVFLAVAESRVHRLLLQASELSVVLIRRIPAPPRQTVCG